MSFTQTRQCSREEGTLGRASRRRSKGQCGVENSWSPSFEIRNRNLMSCLQMVRIVTSVETSFATTTSVVVRWPNWKLLSGEMMLFENEEHGLIRATNTMKRNTKGLIEI